MTATMLAWIVSAVVAGAISFVVVVTIERHGVRIGLCDVPNSRSSHREPRSRGGGVGVIAGVLAGLTVHEVLKPGVHGYDILVLGATAIVAITGLWDDFRPMSIWPRLTVQIGVSVWLVSMVGGLDRVPLPPPADVDLGWLGAPAAVIWLVGVTNFFNFMDGADGLAGGQGTIAFATLAWALWPSSAAVIAWCAVAATAAFLTRNWAPARIFFGDVGSVWTGFLLAALPFAAPIQRRADLVLLVGVSLSLFLLDPLVTLVRRAKRGQPIGVAHREHLYQRLIGPEEPHARAVAPLLVMIAAVSICAAVGYAHTSRAWLGIAAGLVAFAMEWRAAVRRVTSS